MNQLNQARSLCMEEQSVWDPHHQQFIHQSQFISPFTNSSISQMISLLGITPINSFLLELEDEMKEQFMIITQQLALISSIINQEDIEGCIKANSMAIQSLIQRIKQFGCDNFICTRLLTGINQYFKQANWNIDVF